MWSELSSGADVGTRVDSSTLLPARGTASAVGHRLALLVSMCDVTDVTSPR